MINFIMLHTVTVLSSINCFGAHSGNEMRQHEGACSLTSHVKYACICLDLLFLR
ncbi:unnamed protein product [Acanthoscelides obtectus]|uniref:Uncharacterized protein n=1 Tax=Acanthoscelides obtectus TaxID=200917 RepID=A0A9P0KIG2_ACAOB|nr:unnamed protein product [Acanthoscelides obtectus]CAK1656526.1 hypothetical protein AOBTE_LOCUS19773 [Acanthoscelides obtectus]